MINFLDIMDIFANVYFDRAREFPSRYSIAVVRQYEDWGELDQCYEVLMRLHTTNKQSRSGCQMPRHMSLSDTK